MKINVGVLSETHFLGMSNFKLGMSFSFPSRFNLFKMTCIGFGILFGLSFVLFLCEGGTLYSHFYEVIVSFMVAA